MIGPSQNFPHHKHIVTGDLRIIENSKIRKLLTKGPNYREPCTLNFELVKKVVRKGIKNFIQVQSERVGLPVESFSEWKNKLFETIDDKIQTLQTKYRHNRIISSNLKDRNVVFELDALKRKYVITLVDKASKNYAFICKWYYLKVIYK